MARSQPRRPDRRAGVRCGKHDELAKAIEKLTPEEAAFFLWQARGGDAQAQDPADRLPRRDAACGSSAWCSRSSYYGTHDGFVGWVFLVPFALVGVILWAFGKWAEHRVGEPPEAVAPSATTPAASRASIGRHAEHGPGARLLAACGDGGSGRRRRTRAARGTMEPARDSPPLLACTRSPAPRSRCASSAQRRRRRDARDLAAERRPAVRRSSSAARSASSRTSSCCPTPFLDRRPNARGRRSPAASRPARPRVPSAVRDERPVLRLLHDRTNAQRRRALHVSATDPNKADPTRRRSILSIPDFAGNHNGGMIEFGQRRLPLHRHRRRRRRRRSAAATARRSTHGLHRREHASRCSARSCASTSTTRRGGKEYGIPPTTRSPTAAARPRSS